jgi:hypothetical protein
MKWIGGVILLIVTIVLLIVAVFMFPWFTTKTNYERNTIDECCPEYWEDNLGGNERDWDESTFYLQSYELKSSRPLNWSSTKAGSSTSSGMLQYNSQPSAGGWDGSYYSMIQAGYPEPGFLPGGAEQMAVYNFTYYILLFTIIMAVVCIIFIIIAGLEKINAIVPKVIVGVTIIMVVIAPLYFALGLPPAIETDSKEYNRVNDPLNSTSSYHRPAEAGGIMGKANEKDDETSRITSTTEFAPGMGWWLAVGAIFTTIITIGFVTGPGADAGAKPKDDRSRRKYHEYDRMYDQDRSRGPGTGSRPGYGPPPSHRQRTDDYYEEDYDRRDQYEYDSRDQYYDDYQDDGYPPPRGRGYGESPRDRRAPPPPSHDFGRPTPRPPRRPGGHTPSRRARRPPNGY